MECIEKLEGMVLPKIRNRQDVQMRIGFDISQTCESKSGTGFWADQLAKALASEDKENIYTLFPWFYDYRPQTIEKATQVTQKNFEKKIVKNFNDDDSTISRLDIIHSNNFRFPKDVSAKKVVTIYDVCFMDCPEYTTEANRLFCYKGTLDSMLFADKIIAISEYTKQRLLHFFPFVDSSKIDVAYCGNRNTLLKEKNNIELVYKCKLEPLEYFLSVGTIEPRKNYSTLLKAYKLYKENCIGEYKKLCIAGGYGWMEENFRQNIEELGLMGDVVVTGYVSDETLANLYRYCYAFIYPTWYEGFGLPVLEAMNFEKPVIASNVTSIPEIVGDAAALCRPEDSTGIARYMDNLENVKFYNEIVEKEKKRIELFSWEKSAKELVEIYSKLVK